MVCLTEPAASASTARAHIHAERFLALLSQAGRPLASGACVLDFGCGQGALVEALAARGLDAWGCDFSCELGERTDRVRAIPDLYRIPFEDGSFDCVLSDQVFEHVQDYSGALGEIRRVLRPGAVALHIFSPRYEPVEPHTFVPLANIVQTKWWLRLWAAVGVRNRFQRGITAREVAELNYRFLTTQTTYHTRRRVLREARTVFPRARLLDVEVLTELLASKSSSSAGILTKVLGVFPGMATVVCEVYSRALLTE